MAIHETVPVKVELGAGRTDAFVTRVQGETGEKPAVGSLIG